MLYAAGSVLEHVAESLLGVFYIFRTLAASRIINEKLMRSIFSSTFRYFILFSVFGAL